MNRSTGHRFVCNDSAALRKVLGCSEARATSSNKQAYLGLGDQVIQQPTTYTTVTMTVLRAFLVILSQAKASFQRTRSHWPGWPSSSVQQFYALLYLCSSVYSLVACGSHQRHFVWINTMGIYGNVGHFIWNAFYSYIKPWFLVYVDFVAWFLPDARPRTQRHITRLLKVSTNFSITS